MFPWLNNSVEQIQRDFPLIKFSEILSLFFHFKFLRKEGVLPNLEWSRDVTEKINIIQCLLFSKSTAERTDSGFPKTFLRRYLFVFVEHLCNHKLKKKFKKFISIILFVVNYQI